MTVRVRHIVRDVDAANGFDELRGFRDFIISGQGGKQVLAEDPSGNPVELFDPAPRRQ